MGVLQASRRLVECIGKDRIQKNVPLKEHTTFKTGGKARYLISPRSAGEIKFIISLCNEHHLNWYIIGRGSNIIVSDKGFNGLIIKIQDDFNDIEVDGENMNVQSGALLSQIAITALEHDLTGLEFAAGIPGSLGGAVVMNAGAYDGEMSQIVKGLRAVNSRGDFVYLEKEDLKFGYRNSLFKQESYVILEVDLKLKKGNHEEIQAKMKEFSERRKEKQPLRYPSAGSVFKRPEGYFAGKLIEDAGLKGLRIGDAQVSPLHAGFIVNLGQATSQDILDLIAVIKNTVYEKFGVQLEEEVKILK